VWIADVSRCIIHGTHGSLVAYPHVSSVKEHSAHTIGVEFNSRTLRIGDKTVKLQVSRRCISSVEPDFVADDKVSGGTVRIAMGHGRV
jgi:hypothetical protein